MTYYQTSQGAAMATGGAVGGVAAGGGAAGGAMGGVGGVGGVGFATGAAAGGGAVVVNGGAGTGAGAGACCVTAEATAAACVCAGEAGPSVMTFVGYGQGDYITETSYKYVGTGQGTLALVAPPRNIWGRVAALVSVLLIILLIILFWPHPISTTTPPPLPKGECTFWGDPHLTTFDGARPSFYGDGEVWIVKTAEISIQGRYEGTKYTKGLAATNKIAVGGAFLQGHVIMVGTMDSGDLTVDGQPVLAAFPSTYDLAGIATLTYDGEGMLPDKAAAVWQKHIVHMELPKGVSITVYRWANYIDLRIQMPAQPGGQDGSCGNFNGVASDDTTEEIQKRVGVTVASGELLFSHRAAVAFTAAEKQLIAMCKPELYTKAQTECASGLRGGHILNQNKACYLNVCYGSNEHALKFAQSIGL